MAVPLGGAGGKLAIFELNKPGKLPDGVTPTLVNANTIMDFQWDPFDNRRIAVGSYSFLKHYLIRIVDCFW